jgi:2-polyprenyl-3-methyl-5-hydroxy-6-metoxy-1,4-benzoquinol methylase
MNSFVKDVLPPFLWRFLRKNYYRAGISGTAPGGTTAGWYDKAYERTAGYHTHFTGSEYYFLWTVVADRIVRSGATRILDLGCGPGQFAALLQSRGIREYCGVDFSERAIGMARKACSGFTFIREDLERPELLRTLEYDLVVSMEFLEHVSFDKEILNRIRSGARFLGTVPNYPYHSHLRHFSGTKEVAARYGSLFNSFSVDEFLKNAEGERYFLMDGLKK